jgi:hypothetical protein
MASSSKTKTTPSKPTTRKTNAKADTSKTAVKSVASDEAVIKMVEKPAPKPDDTLGREPKLVTEIDPVVTEPELKKRELIDLIVELSGIKKRDAKPVVEAMLSVLGETIAKGRELNLQPFGKLRINRSSIKGNGRVTVCKLRQNLASEGAPDGPLAEVLD